MKRLMLGNEAVARGLYEAGCAFVSSYPGTPSTEITEAAAKYPEIYAEWAPNEKVAMEAAFGASLAGKRSFCGMKHVGLNVAADPLFTIAYTGVNAGMIVGVADDAGMHSSQNEQDSRHYAMAAKLPMLEPSDSAEALEFTKLAYALSEEFDTAVLLKMCTRVSHSQSVVDTGERADIPQKPYEKNGAKYIMMPGNAKRRHPVVEERTRRLVEWAETAPVNRVEEGRDHKLGIITSSTSYQYVKEVCGDTYPVLKLGMIWPLPEKLILDFAASVDALTVVEELDGFIEAHCRSLGLSPTGKDVFPAIDEFNQNLVAAKLGQPATVGPKLEEAIPARPPVMCAGCPHRGLFYTLAKNKLTVLGDIGCYTLGAVAPLSAIDTTICMGASVSGLHGFNKAGGGQGEDLLLHRAGGEHRAVRSHGHQVGLAAGLVSAQQKGGVPVPLQGELLQIAAAVIVAAQQLSLGRNGGHAGLPQGPEGPAALPQVQDHIVAQGAGVVGGGDGVRAEVVQHIELQPALEHAAGLSHGDHRQGGVVR